MKFHVFVTGLGGHGDGIYVGVTKKLYPESWPCS